MSETGPLSICVRFANGEDDLPLLLESGEVTMYELKQTIRERRPSLEDKHLRLLHRGRILKDASQAESLERATIPLDNGDGQSSEPLLGREPIYIHCVVSEAPVSDQQAPQLRGPAVGFDRLIEIGFSREEIEALRSQFHSIRGGDEGEAQNAEEEWIDNRVNREEAAAEVSRDGTHVDLLCGLMVGYFIGIIVVFWIKEQGLFTRRHQMGIIAGLMINIVFGILRLLQ
ncbi:DUF2407 C-terminal domain-containing protein [Polychytrium aggregatum]|uniref:DUF2407 C-terminal domain-containing protein n=1 Tax=Polychytrium aggregatum TaxID=110093 RepID=UPI0022FF0887|nr:DUF2407 C-terminal domain-containing protein [Polychytrium aggregatum]KAI9206854.1 DUF2407 C-terminal domain-containing protein [Polychytrium aggregatum]